MTPLPPQYTDFMVDPWTGLHIPKTLQGNLAWRRKLLDAAKTSASTRRQLKAASASSPIFWLNAFGFTFLQKRVDFTGHEAAVYGESSHVPFITWKIQDEAILEIVAAIDGGFDAMIRKARDMGATWLIVAIFQWYWQFRPSTTFLELSRKEILVDRKGDMDSLFEKHRYLWRWQPAWLRPERVKDNRLHLENLENGSTIEGESTNENAGQASRKTAMLLDEFGRMDAAEQIDLATADTTACRIFNSTPQGPHTHFARMYKQVVSGKRQMKLITLPWWRHPEKGANATVATVEGKEKWSSPWYEDQITRRSKRNIAQNLDMEDGASGDTFFDADVVEKHRQQFQADPVLVGKVAFDDDMTEERKEAVVRGWKHGAVTFVKSGTWKPWRLWVPTIEGRPNQRTRYVFGVDISNGSGASNSVITVLDHATNMIVAKFWDANTGPEDLATIAAMAGLWFGGIKPPLIVFEKNGPGVRFGIKLLKLGYPNIYYQRNDSTKMEERTTRWGWHSSTTRKEMVLGQYGDAMKAGQIINPCREALDEMIEYIYDEHGRVEPGKLGEEEGGGSALHGDHVIADALCQLGRKDLPKTEIDVPSVAPAGSFAARRVAQKRLVNEREAWSK
jgi:hypothetical protein